MKYADTITIDRSEMTLDDLDDVLEAFRELGSAEWIEETPGRIIAVRYEIEADDLWDLREYVEDTHQKVQGYRGMPGHLSLSKDKIVHD